MNWIDRCHFGDCRETMRAMISDGVKVQMIVTSPPYWGLRDYGVDGQIGMEPTLSEFIDTLVVIFDLCRTLLADDGTAWVNMGDAYAGSWGAQSRGGPPSDKSTLRGNGHIGGGPKISKLSAVQVAAAPKGTHTGSLSRNPWLKPKDLMGQPWRLAFALQDAGWYLRQDIIWHKPNPMPESIRDRCTKGHEYLFLLSKSEKYFYDFDAMREPTTGNAHARGTGVNPKSREPSGWDTGPGDHRKVKPRVKQNTSFSAAVTDVVDTRNRRSVWTIPTEAYLGEHFATFPTALVEPCVLAGSRVGDIVFDPFFGTGTTGQVASRLGRHFIGCELNRDYEPLQRDRLRQPGLMLQTV